MLAEDQEDIRWVLVRLLQRAGHDVVATADGVEALDAVRSRHPDLVITDVGMPRMTGFELCRAIRADPRVQNTPVVVVSGAIFPDHADAVDAGVDTVVIKPFIPTELLRQVDRLLARTSGHPSP